MPHISDLWFDLFSIMLSNMSRLSIMSRLVLDLISFEGSYFVKDCYYTLAVVDLLTIHDLL